MKQRTRIEEGHDHPTAVLDVIGIGFGPANLSLAVCMKEPPEGCAQVPRALFLERKPTYEWHPDMLLEGAEIQVPFFKDLVTMRNPRSHFSFLNYLHLHGRLLDFINLRTFFPTRREFNHYYCWVAAQLADLVRYEREVLSVRPVEGDDGIELLQVVARHGATGQMEELLTRNLVMATGGAPHIPPGVEVGRDGKVFHSQSFLSAVKRHFPQPDAPYRFVVVGSGQSAAEIFQYLFLHYPSAEVTAAIRRFAYKPADESHFVNELYSPLMTDFIYDLPEAERRNLFAIHSDTNYSAVDVELIRSIFKALYEMKVAGETRVKLRSMVELRKIEQNGESLVVTLWNKVEGRLERLEADGVVLATGLHRPRRHPLLGELEGYLHTRGEEYQVGRDYRVASVPEFKPAIYLQGFCESTHGLADPVLSILPSRSREIMESLVGICAAGENTEAAHDPALARAAV